MSKEKTKLVSWGILGTGGIAHKFAKGLSASKTGKLEAIGSRTVHSAEAFAAEFGVPRRYAAYEALLADPAIDAVYISLPNHLHLEWVLRCAEAGKHILCEKPLTTNYAEAKIAIDAVRAHDVFMMEAFMYRCHAQTARLADLIRQGAVGQVRVIQAHFSYNMHGPQVNIRQQNSAAGGGIMDVGCYAMSMARLIAGAATGKDFADPIMIHDGGEPHPAVKAYAHIGTDSRVDEWSTAVVRFPGEIVANLTCGIQVALDHQLRIWGSEGHIFVPNPWFPSDPRGGGDSVTKIQIFKDGEAQPKEELVHDSRANYTIEADVVAEHIADRQAPPPNMTWADSLGNMLALDAWRKDVGLVFDVEK
jgi:predicted dehydrogenase